MSSLVWDKSRIELLLLYLGSVSGKYLNSRKTKYKDYNNTELDRKALIIMRIDKYLKVSRIIKRRTVANEACDAGRVLVNGKVVKASADVKIGDVIEVQFGQRTVKIEVVSLNETTKKENAVEMYKDLT